MRCDLAYRYLNDYALCLSPLPLCRVGPRPLAPIWRVAGRKFFSSRSSLTYAMLAKRKLQQRQCKGAAETSLYLNINIIELFLSHGAGF